MLKLSEDEGVWTESVQVDNVPRMVVSDDSEVHKEGVFRVYILGQRLSIFWHLKLIQLLPDSNTKPVGFSTS